MGHIVNNIIKYLNSKDRTGAFQVKGEWGSGKTYFFKEVLPEKIKSETNRLQVMISLFGLGNIKEIPFRLLNAYINKKREQGLSANEDMNRGLDYLDLKYGVDRKLFGVDLHDEDEMIYCIIPKYISALTMWRGLSQKRMWKKFLARLITLRRIWDSR